jgi:hypothetical protein
MIKCEREAGQERLAAGQGLDVPSGGGPRADDLEVLGEAVPVAGQPLPQPRADAARMAHGLALYQDRHAGGNPRRLVSLAAAAASNAP